MPKGLWSKKQLHYCPTCLRRDAPYDHVHTQAERDAYDKRMRLLKLKEAKARNG